MAWSILFVKGGHFVGDWGNIANYNITKKDKPNKMYGMHVYSSYIGILCSKFHLDNLKTLQRWVEGLTTVWNNAMVKVRQSSIKWFFSSPLYRVSVIVAVFDNCQNNTFDEICVKKGVK